MSQCLQMSTAQQEETGSSPGSCNTEHKLFPSNAEKCKSSLSFHQTTASIEGNETHQEQECFQFNVAPNCANSK